MLTWLYASHIVMNVMIFVSAAVADIGKHVVVSNTRAWYSCTHVHSNTQSVSMTAITFYIAYV